MPRASFLGALIAFASVPAIAQAQSPAADAATSGQIRLRYATFDPLFAEPAVAENLRSGDAQHLWIVQFHGVPTQVGRDAVAVAGGQLHGYLPDDSYVVRMAADRAAIVRQLPMVRWVGSYHPAYRLEPELLAGLQGGQLSQPARYNMVVVDKRNDKPALGAAIRGPKRIQQLLLVRLGQRIGGGALVDAGSTQLLEQHIGRHFQFRSKCLNVRTGH